MALSFVRIVSRIASRRVDVGSTTSMEAPMTSVLAILAVMFAGCFLCASSTAADQPGALSIYAQTWESPHGFEPRALTQRERELIHQILAAGGEFQALYVPDVVTGQVDALDQIGAEFGQFSVSCDSFTISRAVRPLCDKLDLPVGLSLRTDPAGDQIAVWQGCSSIRRLSLMHPHMNEDDLVGLSDYPALESLQLGSGSLRSPSFTVMDRGPAYLDEVAGLTNSVVDALAEIETLHRVTLFGCPVTATNLNRLQNVTTLTLRNAELTPQTLASAARLSQLERLDLNGSVVTEEGTVDLSALRHARTIDLPDLRGSLEQKMQQVSGLDQLPVLQALSFSRLHDTNWPDLSAIPDQIQRVEFYDLVLDGVSDLSFDEARLQAHRVLFQRESETGRFTLTEMQENSRDYQRRGCRIAGRQVEAIRVGGQEYEPTDFRIVRFPHWTLEAGFAHEATTSTPDYPDYTPQQRQAVQQLARLDLRAGHEPMGGGFIMGNLADVYLRWGQPLALSGDAADAVDQLVQIPLQKLVITTDEFPLERLAELGKIKTLTSFELRRDGLSDEHLVTIQGWSQLEDLKIDSPDNTFSREVLDLLAKSLPKCDLQITDGQAIAPGGQPLLWRKKPPAGVKKPAITF
jgi:hypothetical protein